MDNNKTYTTVSAVKAFFESDGGRTVSMEEMRGLTKESRTELAELCVAKLGGILKV